MNFTTNYTAFEHDMSEVIRSFSEFDIETAVTHKLLQNGNEVENIFTIADKTYSYKAVLNLDGETDLIKTRLIKREVKLAMYKVMVEYIGTGHKWGSLMGIRPVKLFKSLEQLEHKEPMSYFKDYYMVSDEKTQLVKKIYDLQKPYYATEAKPLDLYIGIPFCVSRCYYCSFISADLRATKQELVESYVDALILDIENAKHIVDKYGYNLRTVYMGGGTPTALNENQLERVLERCNFNVDEFTIEAGRPDTITDKKLQLISQVANRISVNPQTLKDETLTKIGRNHTSKQFYDIYEQAKKYNFDINCDLIAGLMDETADDFERSVRGIIDLSPENITVHTLALKAGSKLKEKTDKNVNDSIMDMLERSYRLIGEAGYNPYYLYRQKYMAGNMENTGFSKTRPCVYNIDIMEENTSNLACGSYGISKRYYPEENRIERFAYPKDVKTYIEKIQANMEKREDLLKD